MKNLLICAVLCLFACAGCDSFMQGLSNLAADPNASGAVEGGASGIAGVAPFFGPVGAAIGTGLLGALAAWRKMKPALAAATTKAERFQAAGSAMVTAIEEFKTTSPDQWDALGKIIEEQLTKQGLDPLVIENVIRGLRGLPTKELPVV